MINEEKQKQIDEFYSAIGFDLAQKENHLNLLASTYKKEYFSYLLSIIPNVSNIDGKGDSVLDLLREYLSNDINKWKSIIENDM